jgi:hypothetical protein
MGMDHTAMSSARFARYASFKGSNKRMPIRLYVGFMHLAEAAERLLDILAMLGEGRKHGSPHEHIGAREIGEDFAGIGEATTGVEHPDEVIGEEGGAVKAMEAEEGMGLPGDAQVFEEGAADEEMVEEAVGEEAAMVGDAGNEMEGSADVAMPAQGNEALLGEEERWRRRRRAPHERIYCLSQMPSTTRHVHKQF